MTIPIPLPCVSADCGFRLGPSVFAISRVGIHSVEKWPGQSSGNAYQALRGFVGIMRFSCVTSRGIPRCARRIPSYLEKRMAISRVWKDTGRRQGILTMKARWELAEFQRSDVAVLSLSLPRVPVSFPYDTFPLPICSVWSPGRPAIPFSHNHRTIISENPIPDIEDTHLIDTSLSDKIAS